MNFNSRFNGEYYIDRRMKNTPTHCYSTRANNVRLIEDFVRFQLSRARVLPIEYPTHQSPSRNKLEIRRSEGNVNALKFDTACTCSN